MTATVLDMTTHKDPDEFIKNLGADRFRERIEKAKNSFLFEIDVLRRQYDMEDPEQKTKFYQETAKKLLTFRESLERDNYIQAVSREQAIPYEELKRLVNRMASHFVPGSKAAGGPGLSGGEESREGDEAGTARSGVSGSTGPFGVSGGTGPLGIPGSLDRSGAPGSLGRGQAADGADTRSSGRHFRRSCGR